MSSTNFDECSTKTEGLGITVDLTSENEAHAVAVSCTENPTVTEDSNMQRAGKPHVSRPIWPTAKPTLLRTLSRNADHLADCNNKYTV